MNIAWNFNRNFRYEHIYRKDISHHLSRISDHKTEYMATEIFYSILAISVGFLFTLLYQPYSILYFVTLFNALILQRSIDHISGSQNIQSISFTLPYNRNFLLICLTRTYDCMQNSKNSYFVLY